MSDFFALIPSEFIEMLQDTSTVDQGHPGKQMPYATRVKLARLLETDEDFKAAVIAVLQTWLTGAGPFEVADL